MSEAKDGGEGKEEKAPDLSWLPEGTTPLADGDYDAIVMGTGLKECILSGLLSVMGMRILHVDRNNYYGGESASVNLTNLYQKFHDGQDPPKEFTDALGHNRDYNVDLVPKMIMACGKLVKMLLHTKVTRYLEFKSIDGSYVYRKGKPYKVPVTKQDVVTSSLVGFFEKRRMISFLMFVQKWDKDKPATHAGYDLNVMTTNELYNAYSLDASTRQFVGHAMALEPDESYLNRPAIRAVEAIRLYCYSLDLYGTSPYLYPLYGLGGLPEGFSRLCAINGGTFMLNTGIEEVLFNEEGVAWGVRGGEGGKQVAKAKMIIGDPSYFPDNKTKLVGRVVRSINILDHPLPFASKLESSQLIIPAAEVGRQNDIYCCMVSNAHQICAAGKYVAICSTTAETSDPKAELEHAHALLGPVMYRFMDVSDVKAPIANGQADRCFISQSYDASSHFESSSVDVLDMYERITGQSADHILAMNADKTKDY